MSDKKQEREEKKKKESVSRRRTYKAPALHGEELFERAVFAACKDTPPPFGGCVPPGPSSG
jgi:hypothetical protein